MTSLGSRPTPSRGVIANGRISQLIGAIQIIRLPFLAFVFTGGIESLPIAFRSILIGLYILVGNQHWGDNIGAFKAIVVDIPLAIVLLVSGGLATKLKRSGRRLALIYAGIALILEVLGFTSVALPQLRGLPGLDQAVVTASFTTKLIYPAFLIVFYSLPGVRRQFSPT